MQEEQTKEYPRGIIMIRKFPTAIALLLASGLASAAVQPEEGWYVGVAGGATQIDKDKIVGGSGIELDDKDSSVQLYGGYKFANWVAIEGRYTTLGEYSLKEGDNETKLDTSALTANMKLIWPWGKSGFDVYGQLGVGVGLWESELPADATTGRPASKVDGNEPLVTLGAGIRWTFIERLTLSLAIDGYQFEATGSTSYPDPGDNTRNVTERVNFKNRIVTTTLGLQYNF